MNKTDYPALYQAADRTSRGAQAAHLILIRGQLFVLIVGAIVGMFGVSSVAAAVVAAGIFLVGIALSVMVHVKGYEGIWYRSRAVAESVKTATWRFMMRAEPFGDALGGRDVEKEFGAVLTKVLVEHRDLASHLSGDMLARDAISNYMRDMRGSSIEQRMDVYSRDRIGEQRQWYAGRADANSTAAKRWQMAFIACQVFAVIFVLLRIGCPEFKYWPVEVLAVCGAAVLTWTQVRRFREHAAAYGMAAHEISVLSASLRDITSEVDLSDFVGDAENAFSREHTQWVARKDVRG